MDFTTSALLIAGAFNLLLAAIIVFQAPKTRANLSYAVLVVALLVWIAAILILRLSSTPTVQFRALAVTYVAGVGIAVSFWYFVAFFTKRHVHSLWHVAVAGGALLVAGLVWFSPAFIRDVTRLSTGGLILNIGPAHWVFMAYFVAVMLDAFTRLFRRYRHSAGTERAQLLAVFLGTALTTVIGATLNVFLVQAGTAAFIAWGPVGTILMVSFIAFAIVRHHLMTIRLIGAELFTLALVILVLVNLVFAPNAVTRLLGSVSLVFAVGFGVLVIRSALRDVELRERLAAANEELRRLDAAKTEFISLASHQLRAPLTVIQGYASMIEETPDRAADVREKARRVAQVSRQLVRLVNDFLDLSRIETGRLQYDIQPTNVEVIVVDVMRELEENARQRNLHLRFENQNDRQLVVQADPAKLHEVVVNLVDNAIKYSPAGEILIRLRPVIGARETTLVLSVADHGIGVSPGDLPTLFQKFVRTSAAKDVRPDGLGLGLYLVKRIVEDHHGRVWAESPGLGQGTAFFVELPASIGARVISRNPEQL